MNLHFYKTLQRGYETENSIAEKFEEAGYSVWRLGSYRLPFDLIVWDEFGTFLVECKYRTRLLWSTISVKTPKLKEIMKEHNLPVLLIIETPNGIEAHSLIQGAVKGSKWIGDLLRMSEGSLDDYIEKLRSNMLLYLYLVLINNKKVFGGE